MSPGPEPAGAGAPRGRRASLRLGALFVGLVIALGGAEVAVRALGLHVARRGGKSDKLMTRVDDRDVGFELVPGRPKQRYVNADGTTTFVQYTINPQGFRGPLVPAAKPAGTLRIAMIGDSFVFGTGVADDGTLPRTLERELAKTALEGRVEVLNFGVPGDGIEELVPRLERNALRYEPDLVLATLYVNDAVATARIGPENARFHVESTLRTSALDWIDRLGLTSNLAEDTTLLPAAQRRTIALRRVSRLVDFAADRLFLTLFSRHTRAIHAHSWRAGGPGWARVREVLLDLKRRGEHEGFALQVAFYPLLDNLTAYPYRAIHERLGAFCDEIGVPFHDLLVPLEGQDAPALWAHVHDHHPNAHCNDLAGRWLAERIGAGLDEL